MGKVVKIVAFAAVAVGIAVFAPALLSAFAFVGTATATAIVTAAFMFAATQAVTGIVRLATGERPGWSKVYYSGGVRSSYPPLAEMPPVRPSLLRRLLSPFQLGRFDIDLTAGVCMAPLLAAPKASVVIDRAAVIRRGDLFAFGARGPWALLWRLTHGGFVKRFIGVDLVAGTIEFEQDNPPAIYTARLADIKWAYRIRWHGRTLLEAAKANFAVRRDPGAFDERLAQASHRISK